ncbi:MAG: winged helix-turn-helix transcriptional regulator [Boseongicola sp.]|nr:MarR family winged helix-turn-helix transcriptional regulator [Boseongicola sp.]NNL18671.1 winged helix-turn-helix transcriptional regulator [Boseongicola sp.]
MDRRCPKARAGHWRQKSVPRDNPTEPLFAFFNEIGIIEQLSRAMMEARLPNGLIVPHFSVINHLIRLGDGRTPLEIARAFQVPKTTMTHTLSGLERHGLVRTAPNPNDARSKCVFITAEGRTFHQNAINALGPVFAKMTNAIPSDDIAAVLPLLTRVRAYLDENRDTV